MQEDIDLFILLVSSRIKEIPLTGMRNSVQRGGGGPLVLVCVYVNQHETGH